MFGSYKHGWGDAISMCSPRITVNYEGCGPEYTGVHWSGHFGITSEDNLNTVAPKRGMDILEAASDALHKLNS